MKEAVLLKHALPGKVSFLAHGREVWSRGANRASYATNLDKRANSLINSALLT